MEVLSAVHKEKLREGPTVHLFRMVFAYFVSSGTSIMLASAMDEDGCKTHDGNRKEQMSGRGNESATATKKDDGFSEPSWKRKAPVVGSPQVRRNRAMVKLTPAPQKVTQLEKNAILEQGTSQQPNKMSWAGICSINGGYSLAKEDLRLGEYEAPFG